MSGNQTYTSTMLPLIEHIQELRRRIIVSLITILIGSVVSFFFYNQIISIFYNPFKNIPSFNQDEVLFVNTVFEGLLIKLKVSILSGIVFSFPIHIYNLIRFIFPGLKKKERRIISISLIISFILIVSSGYYGYFKVIPITLRFLTDSGFIPSGVGIFIISALVTPPDFISQISIALPLITLYFLTILIAKIFRFGEI